MHISNDRYFRERQRHDLALRMIRHVHDQIVHRPDRGPHSQALPHLRDP